MKMQAWDHTKCAVDNIDKQLLISSKWHYYVTKLKRQKRPDGNWILFFAGSQSLQTSFCKSTAVLI